MATPVYAGPTKGQKAAITISWTQLGPPDIIEEKITNDGIVHRHVHVNWSFVLVIDGGPTLTGFANFTERDVLFVPQEDGVGNILLREDYDMSIDGADGGFEGSSTILMDVGVEIRSKAHGLLHGYGDFAGQTINAGHHWVPPGPLIWWGYLLKP